jgi:UDP-N-acetylmuramoyl-tripeptide--D-alanyl-D-alanine ligase
MSALWSVGELTASLGGPASAQMRSDVTGVSIDSRTLQPGDLFVAIRGEVHDGHDHVERAFAAGAAAAVVERARAAPLAEQGPVFAVDDPLRAMERLGIAARARSRARIATVTGSVGKTSAKEMLRVVLAASGATHASAASYNNHWGVPLTLARMPADADFAVFEIGMNHAGEIEPLARMVRPRAALITTIAPVHIEHLGSLEAIADAKAEIFAGLEMGGVAVLNRDAPQFGRLESRARARALRVLAFGAEASCDARLLACEGTERGSRVRANLFGRPIDFAIGAPGRHMAENALGVLLVAKELGADLERSAAALGTFSAQKGRGERFTLAVPGGSAMIIDESYNANPASMRAALALLGASKPGARGRRIAVVGDMLELGPEGARMHAELAGELERNAIDLLFGAGPLTRNLFDAAPQFKRGAWTERASDLTLDVAKELRDGDVVMVKGSNGSRMGPLVAALREMFSRAQASRAQAQI